MAADIASELESTNLCCAELKKKHSKLEEKRNALRQAVKLLEHEVNRLLGENTHLKKVYDKELMRAEQEKEAREKESSIRHELENELHGLKAVLSLYQKNTGSRSFSEDEVKVLEARISECEAEMQRLKELLEREKRRCDSEKKKAKVEKEKAAEAKKLLMIEKSKAEEDRRLTETERNKVEECRLTLEKLKSECKEVREKLIVEKLRADDAIKKVEIEKQKACREKMQADLERRKAEELTRLVELERKKAVDEKVHADNLSQQLEEEKKMREKLENRVEGIIPAQKGRKNKAEECRPTLEKLKSGCKEVKEKLIVEKLKADDAIKKIEIEKHKACREKMRADLGRKKAEEQMKFVELERKKAVDEKVHADNLSQQLEEKKKMREKLEKKVEEIIPAQKESWKFSCGSVTHTVSAEMQLLRKQLKLEKKRVKYAKRMAQLEKAEKSFVGQQVNHIKQEFIQLSYLLNIIAGSLPHSAEGKDGMAKIEESPELLGINLQNKDFGSRPCNFNSQKDPRLIKSFCNDSSYCSGPTKEFNCFHLSEGTCPIAISGISSELESPIRDSIRNKSQNSAVCSTTTTFSDRTIMGSQEREDLYITRSGKFTEGSSRQSSAVRKQVREVGKVRKNGDNGGVMENTDRNYDQRNVGSIHLNSYVHDGMEIVESMSGRSAKKRRTDETMESIGWLYSEDNELHLKMGEKLSRLNGLLGIKDGLPTMVCSHSCEISNHLENGRGVLAEKGDGLCKWNYSHGMSAEEQRQRKLDSYLTSQSDNQQQTNTSESEGIGKPCFVFKTVAPDNQMQYVNICREKSINAVADQAALTCFENARYSDCLKLLELDNDDDERRYRIAMETPLSPTLPEISSPGVHLYGEDESHYLVEGLPRSSESGIDNSASFHNFDVIDLDINANTGKLDTSTTKELLSRNIRDFTHLFEEPKYGGLFMSHTDFNQKGIAHAIEHNSYIQNSTFVDEQMCDMESKDLKNAASPLSIMELEAPYWQAKPPSECSDHRTTPNSNLSDDSVPTKVDKCLPSGDANHNFSKHIVHSELLHKDGCEQSYNVEIGNLSRNTFPVANGLEKTIGTDQVPSLGLIKSQIEVERKEFDNIGIAECLNQGLRDSETRKLVDDGNNSLYADQAAEIHIRMVSECNPITGIAKQMPMSTIRKLEYPCGMNYAFERIPKYCVVFSNTKDEGSILRIIHARNTLMYQNFMDQADCDIAEILHSLKVKTDLLPEEKVSVFFSLLLCGFSGTMVTNSKSMTNGGILHCSESFAAKLSRVISDGKIGWLSEEICQLDILLNLIEDFLIDRKILMYIDMQSESLYPCVSSHKFCSLEGGNMFVSYSAAPFDQFVAGSIILACICSAANCIGFLLEASYKILRICKGDTSWILWALHVFASVTGEKFFSQNNYNFLISAIRTVVSLLERGHESLSFTSPFRHSACDLGPSFPPCEQCPFYTNAISVDKFAPLLVDMLQDFASGAGHLSSADSVLACVERDEESASHRHEFDGLNINCDSSCMLFKYRNATDPSDCISERSFCCYTDIVSLMELVGCYMSWEWTFNNVMPLLLEVLESCASVEFSAAIFVLIGQLARFGIDIGGYQQSGVAELRCSLSKFLNAFIIGRGSLPTQFAAVGALLNLLPLSFGEIVDRCAEHSVDSSQSIDTELIKKWFYQLSEDLQSSALSFFRDTDVQKF